MASCSILAEADTSNTTEVLVGVVIVMATGIIAWFSKKLWGRLYDDKIALKATFEQAGSIELINIHGCTGLILTVVNKRKRVAKIKRAQITAQHVDLMQQMQQGFDQDFGYTPAEGAPPPVLFIELIPLTPKTNESGWNLERDDAVEFFLPILAPPVLSFPELPSEDLGIAITLTNGEEIELLRGSVVQSPIQHLREFWGDRLAEQQLKSTIQYNMKVSSSTPATMDAVGHTNTRAISVENYESTNPSAIHRRRN